MFRGFTGYIQADAHSVYHALFRGEAVEEVEKPPDEVACWSHTRRKFEPETYLAEISHIMPLWPRERSLELAPRYWKNTRSRLNPAELARELGPITVMPPASEKQSSTD